MNNSIFLPRRPYSYRKEYQFDDWKGKTVSIDGTDYVLGDAPHFLEPDLMHGGWPRDIEVEANAFAPDGREFYIAWEIPADDNDPMLPINYDGYEYYQDCPAWQAYLTESKSICMERAIVRFTDDLEDD